MIWESVWAPHSLGRNYLLLTLASSIFYTPHLNPGAPLPPHIFQRCVARTVGPQYLMFVE